MEKQISQCTIGPIKKKKNERDQLHLKGNQEKLEKNLNFSKIVTKTAFEKIIPI